VIVRVLFASLLSFACLGQVFAQGSVSAGEYDRLSPIDAPYPIDGQTELIVAAYEFAGAYRVMIHARNLESGQVTQVADLPVRQWRMDPDMSVLIATISAIDVNQDGQAEIVLTRNLHPHGWQDRIMGQVEEGADWIEIVAIAGWSTNHDFANSGFVVGDDGSEVWGRNLGDGIDQCWRWVPGVELREYVVSEGPCHRQTDRAILRASRLNIIFEHPEDESD
jgi:hypothetical protein